MVIPPRRFTFLPIFVCTLAISFMMVILSIPHPHRELSVLEATKITGQGPEDPCSYRLVTTACEIYIEGPNACSSNFDRDNPGCVGVCTDIYYCSGEDMHSYCASGYGPWSGTPPTLSECSDGGSMTCGQGRRGFGECIEHLVPDSDFGTIALCECNSGADPDGNCDDEDVDHIETDCEDGGAPV